MISGASELHAFFLILLVVLAILLAGDDDLPGPRRSYARAPSDSKIPL